MSDLSVLEQELQFSRVHYLRRLEARVKNNMRLVLQSLEGCTHDLHHGKCQWRDYATERKNVTDLLESLVNSSGEIAGTNKGVTILTGGDDA